MGLLARGYPPSENGRLGWRIADSGFVSGQRTKPDQPQTLLAVWAIVVSLAISSSTVIELPMIEVAKPH